jgi:hypothetical protein
LSSYTQISKTTSANEDGYTNGAGYKRKRTFKKNLIVSGLSWVRTRTMIDDF